MELSWFVFWIIGMAMGTIFGSWVTDDWWKERGNQDESDSRESAM